MLDGWFDLEAVARAGLAAIVEPSRDVATAGGNANYWARSLGGEATACVTKAAALAAWRAMIGEMLVPTFDRSALRQQSDAALRTDDRLDEPKTPLKGGPV